MSEKTHDPSPQRLRQARREGQVPKSRLLNSAAVSFGALTGLLTTAPTSAARLQAFTARVLGLGLTPEGALAEGLSTLAACAAPALVGAMLAALAVGVATAGVELNVEQVAPKLERIDPLSGFKRLANPAQLLELGKGLLVAGVVLLVAWSGVSGAAHVALTTVLHEGPRGLLAVLQLVANLVWRLVMVLVVLGVADGWLARRKLRNQLMMSHEEVKQEHKSSEGDPHHKAQRKSLHKQLAQGGPARGVQKATAVVVNPTHIAVALRFDERECEAPYLVARGREEDALAIRKEAARLGIPIVKDIPLARSLVHYDVGEEVPEELYKAAAAVLKVALEASRERASGPEGKTP